MTAIPTDFRAFVSGTIDERPRRGVRRFAESELPDGEVEIRVGWSSVNYKDGLATRPDGRVARINPIIPGIDLAGEVVFSSDPAFAVGDAVTGATRNINACRPAGSCRWRPG